MSRPLRDVPAHALLGALAAALEDDGPAVRPVPADDATGGASARAVSDSEVPPVVDDGVAVVVRTSGSTGEPREVLLSAAALRASADATHARLDGPGRWLLALPVHHVAGLQVLVRSVLAGTTPAVLRPGPFRADAFVDAVTDMAGDGPTYTSLVPTQLVRLLDDPAATAALAAFDAVLLGGAGTAPDVLARARAAGVRVVTTYGITETCGGCVYDGVPLDGVRASLDDTGRVLLAGPVLADGYRGRPDLDATAFTTTPAGRALRTTDLGRLDGGVLTVLGRADDVLVTGGVKVAPAAVEAVLAGLAEVREVCVVGVPDAQWGQAVVAVVVPRAGAAPALAHVRALVAERLGPAHAPRRVVAVDALPLRGPGKVDRAAVARLVAAGGAAATSTTSTDHDDAGGTPAPTGRSGA